MALSIPQITSRLTMAWLDIIYWKRHGSNGHLSEGYKKPRKTLARINDLHSKTRSQDLQHRPLSSGPLWTQQRTAGNILISWWKAGISREILSMELPQLCRRKHPKHPIWHCTTLLDNFQLVHPRCVCSTMSRFQLSLVYAHCTVHPIGLLLFSSHTRPEDGPIERVETCRLLLRI